jgi:hypothetical protein
LGCWKLLIAPAIVLVVAAVLPLTSRNNEADFELEGASQFEREKNILVLGLNKP